MPASAMVIYKCKAYEAWRVARHQHFTDEKVP